MKEPGASAAKSMDKDANGRGKCTKIAATFIPQTCTIILFYFRIQKISYIFGSRYAPSSSAAGGVRIFSKTYFENIFQPTQILCAT
jgi:hypothetical protein